MYLILSLTACSLCPIVGEGEVSVILIETRIPLIFNRIAHSAHKYAILGGGMRMWTNSLINFI